MYNLLVVLILGVLNWQIVARVIKYIHVQAIPCMYTVHMICSCSFATKQSISASQTVYTVAKRQQS